MAILEVRGGGDRGLAGSSTDEDFAFVLSVNNDNEPARIAMVPAIRTMSLATERMRSEQRLRLRKAATEERETAREGETTATIDEVTLTYPNRV